MSKSSLTLSLLQKGLKLSLINIWRNKFLSIATIFVIGTILFIFNVILTINFIAKDALTELSKKIDVTVYLKESTTFEIASSISKEVETLEGIEKVTYTSKEDALAKIKTTHPDISVAFEKYKLGNPLPASLNITTTHPKYHAEIEKFLSQEKYKTYLSSVTTSENSGNSSIITSVSKNLLKVSDFGEQIVFWLIITFVIGGALIILNALQITIFNRKKEISVMKLVGASYWFIRFPFIIESIIYGITAVILSFIMLFIISQRIQIDYSNMEFYKIFGIEIALTIILSIFSSMVAVHEYLKQKPLED